MAGRHQPPHSCVCVLQFWHTCISLLHFSILNLTQFSLCNPITSRSTSWTVSGNHRVLLNRPPPQSRAHLSLFLPCCPMMFLLGLFYFLLKPLQGYQEMLIVKNSYLYLLCLPIPYLYEIYCYHILYHLSHTPFTPIDSFHLPTSPFLHHVMLK